MTTRRTLCGMLAAGLIMPAMAAEPGRTLVVSELSRRFVEQPFSVLNLSFVLENRTTLPVAKIRFDFELRSPGRSVPWEKQSFEHAIAGGVEPGERRKLELSLMGQWRQVPPELREATIATVTIRSFDDAKGHRHSLD